MSGPATKVFPMLSVEDLDRSVAFYRGILGGVESYRFPAEGAPVFVVLQFGTTEIGLGVIVPEGPLHGQQIRPATGHRVELCVYVDDVDHVVALMRRAGAPIMVEPVDQPWGERIAYVSDPDGNLVMLTL